MFQSSLRMTFASSSGVKRGAVSGTCMISCFSSLPLSCSPNSENLVSGFSLCRCISEVKASFSCKILLRIFNPALLRVRERTREAGPSQQYLISKCPSPPDYMLRGSAGLTSRRLRLRCRFHEFPGLRSNAEDARQMLTRSASCKMSGWAGRRTKCGVPALCSAPYEFSLTFSIHTSLAPLPGAFGISPSSRSQRQ